LFFQGNSVKNAAHVFGAAASSSRAVKITSGPTVILINVVTTPPLCTSVHVSFAFAGVV